MKILISACLLGTCCRYDGTGTKLEGINTLSSQHTLVSVCPEQLGGLPTPRPPAEIKDGKALTAEGTDVTCQFQKGALETIKLAELYECDCAILKSKSPSCGCGFIYDGSFTRHLIEGDGFTASLLKKKGIPIMNEKNYKSLLKASQN